MIWENKEDYKVTYYLKSIDNADISSIWDYLNTSTALKGLLSHGPIAKVFRNSGFDIV